MLKPSLKEFMTYSEQYNFIPIYLEIYNDDQTLSSMFHNLEKDRICYLLESVEGGEHIGRFSFLGIDPLLKLTVEAEERVILEQNKNIEICTDNCFTVIEKTMEKIKIPEIAGLPRFYGGLVGYMAYETIELLEKKLKQDRQDSKTPLMSFVLAEKLIIFDNLFQKYYFVMLVPAAKKELAYQQGTKELDELAKTLFNNTLRQNNSFDSEKSQDEALKFTSNFSKEAFMEAVKTAKEYILAGDILQVVLSQKLMIKHTAKPFNIYRALRRINPSPYLYYLNYGDFQIIGSSPEMLVRVENNFLETRPIAGTRPRGKDKKEDESLKLDLLDNEKEKAEHIMLVDLGRNDLGKVSTFGSVYVDELMTVENFSHVMHMVTTVKGELAEDKSSLDAFLSCFPAGTVSGAPKVRAMEIIQELEPERRGIYAGAICYLGANGSLDSCITIRTIVNHGEEAHIQAGAGIVLDSDPEKEFEETLHKAKAMLKAVQMGEGITC